MNTNLLPFINSLRSAVANLDTDNTSSSFGSIGQGAARLLDYMLVQQTTAKELQAECFAAVAKLLPDLRRLITADTSFAGDNPPATLRELETICASNDFAAFERFLSLTSTIVESLAPLDNAAARAVRKAIVAMEAGYSRGLEAAVDAQVEASKQINRGGFAIRNTRSYDERALLDFLRTWFPDEVDLGIEKSGFITGGTSKFTMLITLASNKSLPTEIVLRGDADGTFGGASVTYEYRLIKAVYENGGCVPKPLALEETGKVFGSPFMLVEKRTGRSIGHMHNLPKQPNPALNEDIAAKLAALHRIPTEAFGSWINGVDMPSSAKALQWIDEGLRNWLPLAMPSPVFATAFDWLRRNAHINDRAPRTLVHGDYGLNNILVDDSKVTAILDWEFAHIANPAYDLGYYRIMAEPLSSWQHFLRSYEQAGGPLPDEDQLNYACLFAATRLGVMVAQVTRAFANGNETGQVGTMVVAGNYYDMTIKNIGLALDAVL